MEVGRKTGDDGSSDYLSILSGTSQNIVGIVIAAIATLGANVIMGRVLGPSGFGVVTLVTQAAFVASFATRAGMDMAVLRNVAVEVGVSRWDNIRTPVARAAVIAVGISTLVGFVSFVAAAAVRNLFSIHDELGRWAVEFAALGLPFLALANVWLSATRGLKIMRYTLYFFWAGQPLGWVVLMVIGFRWSETTWMGAATYSLSWAIASAAAYWAWKRESHTWPVTPMARGALGRLVRFAGPRAPAALFSQLLFWTDLFVLTRFASESEIGVYSAALRGGQMIVLFITSVSLMFSPFVADLHNRGEIRRLDGLFKTLTRWTVAATIPVLLLLAIEPGSALKVFGPDFAGGQTALLILLAGQVVNIATGSVGFILIMVGRTGWDLVVYAGSLIMNLGIAFWLCPRYGMEGAAIANAATFATSTWARLMLVRHFVGIQPYDRNYLKLIVPTLVAAVVMFAVHRVTAGSWAVDLVATGSLGALAYGLTYLWLGLTEAERRGIAGLRARLAAR
ncbi:MAG: polysaccharide biosynthesis protein [Actinobacteria bacterium]|nr:polysaccharide biosynthesis protein [Actinomycetota bacterium]